MLSCIVYSQWFEIYFTFLILHLDSIIRRNDNNIKLKDQNFIDILSTKMSNLYYIPYVSNENRFYFLFY